MNHHHHPHTLIADFTTGNVNRQLVSFAMPMFLSHLLQIVYNMADMIIVGQTLGKVGLSAISVGGDIMNCMTFIAMGFSSAGQVLIAQYIGAKQHDKLSRFVATMSAALFGFACCVTGIGLLFRREIMELMHTPPEAFAEALSYAGISMAGIIFVYGYNAVSAILRGMGDAKHPFYFISLAALLNIVLDVIFVMQMGTGAKGAALATILSQGVSFLLCAGFICKNRERYHFSKMFVNSWVNSFGVAVSAFAGVANKINMSVNMMSNSVNTAGASMVGQNIGSARRSTTGCGRSCLRFTASCLQWLRLLPSSSISSRNRFTVFLQTTRRSSGSATNIFPLRSWLSSAVRDEAAATR